MPSTDDSTRELDASERAEAATIGVRLAEEFAQLVAELPVKPRKIRELAECLGVNWNTCQRLLAAIKARNEPLEVLIRAPGVQGLREIAARAEEKGCRPDTVVAANAAIDRFDSLVRRLGSSHTRLRARVERTLGTDRIVGPGGETEHDLQVRGRLHAGAVELMGKEMDLRLSISLVRPVPEQPAQIERAGVTGFIGQRARPGATPMVVSFRHASDRPEGVDPSIRYDAIGRGQSVLLSEFSTTPLPTVASRDPTGGVLHTIDPSAAQVGGAIDAVVGHRMAPVSHPATHDTPTMNLLCTMRSPARRMIFDTYLHRSLAKSSVPSAGVYLFLPSPGADSPRWHERIPGEIELRLLAAPSGGESDAWPRCGELTRALFEMVGWPADAFIGYRCDVRFPVCGASYMVTFDFGGSDDECAEG